MIESMELLKARNMQMWVRLENGNNTMDYALLEEKFIDNIFAQSVFNLPKGSVVLDAGAHIGTYTFRILDDRRDLLVIAMEPIPDNYGLFIKNVIANNLHDRIYPLQFALSSIEGYINLFNYGNEGAWSAIPQNIKSIRHIPVYGITLKDVMNLTQVDNIDYIKLDIEGMETSVLQSLDLSRVKGLDVECHNNSIEYLQSYLSKQGFNVKR